MKQTVPCNNSLLVSAGKSLQPYYKICVKSSFEGLVNLVVLLKVELYREGLFSEYQKRSRAAKSVPHSQHHHSMDTLHLVHL